jgi:hypothetical protein
MANRIVGFRWILLFVILCLVGGCGKAETDVSRNEKRMAAKEDYSDFQGEPYFRLYYASVACSCTMARCKAALALCDSMQKSDSAFVCQLVDVYIDTLAADSVAVWEVPVLMLLDPIGRERDRQEWDITVDDIHRLLQKGETQ